MRARVTSTKKRSYFPFLALLPRSVRKPSISRERNRQDVCNDHRKVAVESPRFQDPVKVAHMAIDRGEIGIGWQI